MIFIKILEHDLHMSKGGAAMVLMEEVPALPGFVPAIISNTSGNFLVARKLKDDSRIRVGVFPWDSDRIDDLIQPMISEAMKLSSDEGWPNVFVGAGSVRRAFSYVQKESGMEGQPHVCLIPSSWTTDRTRKVFGSNNLDEHSRKYKKYCHLIPSSTIVPVFLSRPDMVGMYTQYLGGRSSILLHNVRRGMAFCPDFDESPKL